MGIFVNPLSLLIFRADFSLNINKTGHVFTARSKFQNLVFVLQ